MTAPERVYYYPDADPECAFEFSKRDGAYDDSVAPVEYVRLDVHDAEVKRLRDLVYVLTGLIAPRCFNCSRPATKHNARTASFGDAASQYACDEHAKGYETVTHPVDQNTTGPVTLWKKWHDLPAASAIRDAMKVRPGGGG